MFRMLFGEKARRKASFLFLRRQREKLLRLGWGSVLSAFLKSPSIAWPKYRSRSLLSKTFPARGSIGRSWIRQRTFHRNQPNGQITAPSGPILPSNRERLGRSDP